MNDIERAIESLKMENALMQFDPITGEDYPIELQNQDNQDLYNANLVAISALEEKLNGGWVPVSERLPDNNAKVQVTGVRYSEYTKKYIYVRFNAKYIGKHSIKVDDMWSYCEDYDWNDYVEEEDEYYVKEGWYETIENWDDYTELSVSDYKVIAWMPLPSVYKEVENE